MSGFLKAQKTITKNKADYFTNSNKAYIESLYNDYLKNPNSVDKQWQKFFEGFEFGLDQSQVPQATSQVSDIHLIEDLRNQAHIYAKLDPLNLTNKDPKELYKRLGLPKRQETSETNGHASSKNSVNSQNTDKISSLIKVYCSTLSVQFNNCSEDKRSFLINEFENKSISLGLSAERKKRLLYELTSVEAMEKFLHSRFVGMKRFSIEGNDTGITLLETILQEASIKEIIIGMAHRGRINVLTNFMGKAVRNVLAEFDGRVEAHLTNPGGDVKYHLGFSTDRKTEKGSVHISLAFNPSHLESVTPVVAGSTWAKQLLQNDSEKDQILPVIIHGDAAFSGQGVIYELLQMGKLKGYDVGGIIHIIFDNQIGFTTTPEDARSTPYSSDIAKVWDIPVIHVNADAVESVVRAAQIAVAYRETFKSDIVIRHLGYRRYGHNEGDEPMYTQPYMYQVIKEHPSVYQIWSKQLIAEGVVTTDEVQMFYKNKIAQLQEILDAVRSEPQKTQVEVIGGAWKGLKKVSDDQSQFLFVETAALKTDVDKTFEAMTRPPKGFCWHPKLEKQYKKAYQNYIDNRLINWSFAEMAAYGTLILEGVSVRLTGQDVVRGTFSHRHAHFFDNQTEEEYSPLNTLNSDKASFFIHNSLLSEVAALGFDYGISTANPWMLTIWEAQFGDFANGAQVIIDQFIVSAEEKWNRMSGIVLFLPHGYEGQGPEHSSARLERYLTQCINNNIQVCYPTTPTQIFHLLRRQQKRDFRKPLIVMSPKSLLRHPKVISHVDELCNEDIGFKEVLLDSTVDPNTAKEVLLCSGKIYYELIAEREKQTLQTKSKQHQAILRLEQIYPFPYHKLRDILTNYPHLQRICWVQEESQNMGAFHFVSFYIYSLLRSLNLEKEFKYIGRPPSSSPATGSSQRHKLEQQKIIQTALKQS